jgi:hypothetical protein
MTVRIKDKDSVTEVDATDYFGIDGTVGLRKWSWANLVAGLKSGTKLASGLTSTFFQDIAEKGVADGYASLGTDGKVPASQLPAPALNTQTGTSYTLVLSDAKAIVEMNNAAANTLTIPPNSSVAFPLNTTLDIVQYGAGATSLVAGAGVTLRGGLVSNGQYTGWSIYKRSDDEWVLTGGTK